MQVSLVDIHSHILPGVDDGAATVEEALEMLRIAELDGIDRIVATPHVPPKPGVDLIPEQIVALVGSLNEMVSNNAIPIEILVGSEIRVEPNIVESLQRGDMLTLNGSPYVLLELPLFGEWPAHVRDTIFDLQMAGYVPVLAHVERYPAVQRDPDLLEELVSTGVLMQVNADSIMGNSGGRARATARRLLRSHMAHIVASDAHSPRSRAPRIALAYERISSLVAVEYAEWMHNASEAIVNGAPIFPPEPLRNRSGRWWSNLWPSSGR